MDYRYWKPALAVLIVYVAFIAAARLFLGPPRPEEEEEW